MKVYRVPVNSAARQSGHEYDFQWDLSGFTTARDLKGHTWMAAVEWSDPIKYSEETPTFASHVLHPSALFLTCPELTQHNTWESWSGAPSSTICVYPNYVSTGFYGLSADPPYCRKKAMGCLVQGDRLNQAGSLQFRVLREGDDNDKDVRPCLPVGAEADGGDFSFSLVFWQVSGLSPEQPLSPTYNFFKVFLRSADRSSGTSADCFIPIRLSTGGSMLSGAWQIAAEPCGPLYHAGGARGLVLVSDTFRHAGSGGAPLAHLSRSHRIGEDDHYGFRLTSKPLPRDHIGHPVTRPPDNIGAIHLEVLSSDGLVPLVYPETLSDWAITLYFYRVDK
jgi:hypothetical protein